MNGSSDRQSEFSQLMEQIRLAHRVFAKAWAEAKASALRGIPSNNNRHSFEQIWHANGIAYRAARPLSERRDRLLEKLFVGHIRPLQHEFNAGNPDAVDAIIDYLEVDVPAFHCGYAKEYFLRKLKTIRLTENHCQRLRDYGHRLCREQAHRREIREAGRLMILLADRNFVEQLQSLATQGDVWQRKKAVKMLRVVQNGRTDLR
jgi:hypothetical protein